MCDQFLSTQSYSFPCKLFVCFLHSIYLDMLYFIRENKSLFSYKSIIIIEFLWKVYVFKKLSSDNNFRCRKSYISNFILVGHKKIESTKMTSQINYWEQKYFQRDLRADSNFHGNFRLLNTMVLHFSKHRFHSTSNQF